MRKIIIFGLLVISVLFLVGCGQKDVEADTLEDVIVENTTELEVIEPEPEVPVITEINLNVLTKEWDLEGEGQETVTLKTRELEKGYKFTGSNCFLCGAQLFTLDDIVSEDSVLISYDDALEPVGGGENPILIGSDGKCFHVESMDLGVDICLEIA